MPPQRRRPSDDAIEESEAPQRSAGYIMVSPDEFESVTVKEESEECMSPEPAEEDDPLFSCRDSQINQDVVADTCGEERPKKRQKMNYTSQDILDALAFMRTPDCKSIRQASHLFGIPASTLYDKFMGNKPVICRVGPNPILEQLGAKAGLKVSLEESLHQHLLELASRGFCLRLEMLLAVTQSLLQTFGVKSPFPNGQPGRSWVSGFLNRFPDLKKLWEEHRVQHSSKSLITNGIKEWLQSLNEFAAQRDLVEALRSPERVLMCDELHLKICLSNGTFKSAKEEEDGSRTDNFSVKVTASADGEVLAPFLTLKGNKVVLSVYKSRPPKWEYEATPDGCSNGRSMVTFAKHLQKALSQKGLLDLTGSRQKVFLFLSSRPAHFDIEFFRFCDNHGIVLFALPPKALTRLNPLQLSVSNQLENLGSESKQKTSTKDRVSRLNVGAKLEEVIGGISKETIQNDFKLCGLSSILDISYIQLNQHEQSLPGAETENSASPSITSDPESQIPSAGQQAQSKRLADHQNAIETLELFIEAGTLCRMNLDWAEGREWSGSEKFRGLFEVWCKMKDLQQ